MIKRIKVRRKSVQNSRLLKRQSLLQVSQEKRGKLKKKCNFYLREKKSLRNISKKFRFSIKIKA